MNKGDVLYVSGMNVSDHGSDDGVWDDKRLREAYDRATKIAEETVAKRLAMETNSSPAAGGQESARKSKPKTTKWCVGKSCRAVFEEDGGEYEAVITDIIDDKECVVKYLGYDNQAVVPISSLSSSWGKLEVSRQVEAAHETELYHLDLHADCPSESTEKKRKSHKSSKSKRGKLELPQLPPNMFPQMPNFQGLQLPLGVPLPPPPSCGDEEEQQALTSMLLSSYLAGYYSGLYQGVRNTKSKRHH